MGDKTFLNTISLKAKEASDEVRKFSLLIWHASIGTVVKLEQESSKLLAELVKEGEKRELRLKHKATQKSKHSLAESDILSFDAQIKKLESVLEKSLNLVLRKLGIPAKSELEDLSNRIEALSQNIGLVAAKRAKA